MGLDMKAYAVTKSEADTLGVVITKNELDTVDRKLFYQWKNILGLHEFMEKVYREFYKGQNEFNCILIKVEISHLDALEQAFCGSVNDVEFEEVSNSEKAEISEYICIAKALIAKGYVIYFDSWY